MQRLRIGLIGAGGWGAMHARTYASTPSAHLWGIADLDPARAGELARTHGVQAYSHWQALLDDPNVQAVAVVTPDFAHEDIILAAAEAGKHILAEKPLAMSVEACERILETAQRAGVKLMVDFHARFSPPIHKAWESVRAGEIGRPVHAYYRLNDRISVPTQMLSWAARSSVLWFVGSHAVDTVRWLVGDEVCRVYAVSRSGVLTGMGIETPDYYQSVLEFRNGTTAIVENSWILPETAPSLVDVKCELVGTRGALYVDQSHNRALEKYTADGGSLPDAFVMPSIFGVQQGFAAASIRHFVDAVLYGLPLQASGADGLEVTRILCAVERSVAEQRPIDL